MKITYRKVNEHAWVNNTWLAPYDGYVVKLIEYTSGRIDLVLNGKRHKNVEGNYVSEHNGWRYTTKKLLGRPIKNK